jgi:hypothetical protein
MASKSKQSKTKDIESSAIKANDKTLTNEDELDIDPLDDDSIIEVELSKKEQQENGRTLAASECLHQKLISDVEAYLANGGQIHQVDSFKNSAPPKRHVNQFGKNSI